jgi:heme/copper-type cytochrome/quinol oxidase subunit 4
MKTTLFRPEERGQLKFYLMGFITCIVLTLAAYFLVAEKLLTGWPLIFTILGLGVIQMAAQLLFFMHLRRLRQKSPLEPARFFLHGHGPYHHRLWLALDHVQLKLP